MLDMVIDLEIIFDHVDIFEEHNAWSVLFNVGAEVEKEIIAYLHWCLS